MVKLKIALVIHSLQAGGMERVMSELVEYYSGNINYEVHLMLYGIKRDIFYKLPENIRIHKPDFQFNDKKRFITVTKQKWIIDKYSVGQRGVWSMELSKNFFVLQQPMERDK